MPASTTASAHAITGMDIVAYLVKDAARATAFYRDTLGLPLLMEYPDGAGAEFELPDGSTFGIWRDPAGHWRESGTVMFRVADARQAKEFYGARGVQFDDMVHDGEACTMAFCKDTEGNSIIFHTRKTPA